MYEVYTWGRAEGFNLGYPMHTEERKKPNRVVFERQEHGQSVTLESIRDIKASDTMTLALSESGQVYSWGSGSNGRLGHNNCETQICPKLIKFDFKDENKKIR